jgi:hypothetical protein
LHDITVPSSVHFQHVGQQTLMTTAHSRQENRRARMRCLDGAMTVTDSAQTVPLSPSEGVGGHGG